VSAPHLPPEAVFAAVAVGGLFSRACDETPDAVELRISCTRVEGLFAPSVVYELVDRTGLALAGGQL
jgi:hypothetical protein